MGTRPRDAVFSCLKFSDLFVLNSSYEGLPHIVLEAMLVFVPVIATDTGGTGELVKMSIMVFLFNLETGKVLKFY